MGITYCSQHSSKHFQHPATHYRYILKYEQYRKIPKISPGLIEVRKHFWGAYIRRGLYSGGLIFGGHFVLVSEYRDLKIQCYISLL